MLIHKQTRILSRQVWAAGICLASQAFFFGSAWALPMLSSRKPTLQAPSYEKLNDGAGPTTNDVLNDTPVANNSLITAPMIGGNGSDTNRNGSSGVDLRPLKLTGDNPAAQTSGAEDTAGGVLKSTITATGFAAPAQDVAALKTVSIGSEQIGKGKKGKSLVEQAKDVGVAPVPLLVSDEEAKKKAEATLDAEKEELADLWESTLTRSPDIQFVIQKLQPTTSQAHLSNVLTRMLSTAAFGAMGAVAMTSPGVGTYAISSAGSSMIQNVLGMQDSKNAKRAKLSQEEQMMMFSIVRNTCDKLVASYRDYKKFAVSLSRAAQDLQDLQGMVAEARSGQDATKQLEMEYTLRKQQRDLETIADDLHRHRESLVDLAGSEAVVKLDKQINEEQLRIEHLTNNVLTNNPDSKVPVVDNVPKTEQLNDNGESRTQTASNPSPQS